MIYTLAQKINLSNLFIYLKFNLMKEWILDLKTMLAMAKR